MNGVLPPVPRLVAQKIKRRTTLPPRGPESLHSADPVSRRDAAYSSLMLTGGELGRLKRCSECTRIQPVPEWKQVYVHPLRSPRKSASSASWDILRTSWITRSLVQGEAAANQNALNEQTRPMRDWLRGLRPRLLRAGGCAGCPYRCYASIGGCRKCPR
ncbi:hypothetical protein CSUI_003295 [Cystoisospora suis]|uniref:Uncharacterized protein n=1 Tax=Cystoisospora suis TaxID=483139 RepID=A0A2C6L5F6_9APIC|nr:hypothetical protein CSUI_003295 [Cystoisospora suis]